jgi:hypothetical protein
MSALSETQRSRDSSITPRTAVRVHAEEGRLPAARYDYAEAPEGAEVLDEAEAFDAAPQEGIAARQAYQQQGRERGDGTGHDGDRPAAGYTAFVDEPSPR